MSTIHKLYLDDSGTKEYSPTGKYAIRGGGTTPYFVFGGLLVTPVVAGLLHDSLRLLKAECFGTHQVEIKANWLKRPTEREKRYLNPYGISPEQLDRFVEDVYTLIADSDCKLIGCAVNKSEVQAKYKEKSHYPPAIAYDCVMQRAQQEMEELAGRVHTTIDHMDGGTPKGSQYKDNLKRHHSRLRARGSAYQRSMKFDRLDELTFSASEADERLQLADLIAYCLYRQFVDHGPDWEMKTPLLPCYPYFNRLVHRFRSGPDGRVQGYGVVKFPLNARVEWKLRGAQKKP